MSICRVNECNLDVHDGYDECILHCSKNGLDFFKIRTDFYKSLEDYVANNSIDGNAFCHFSRITFPKPDIQSKINYAKILNKLKQVHFDNCHFFTSYIESSDPEFFFQDCIFHERWSVFNAPILKNVNGVLYQNCTFHKEVSSYSEDDGKYVIDSQLFNDCEFKENIEFGNVEFKSPIFNNTDDIDLNIESLHLIDCILKEKFILNRCNINSFFMEDTIFESKFEFKKNIVSDFKIFNTNYFKVVDTFETKFGKFNIKKSIFDDFVGFEKCSFGENVDSENKYIAKFTYATFLSFVNFRNTNFCSGLDIENINLKESPNFLNTNINEKYSNRETFRIIKSSFDKIHNYIEANRYFTYEMQKYKEELKGSNKTQEKLMLFLNEKISNYGQSYIRPIFYMIATSIIYYLLILGYENNILYEIHPSINGTLEKISSFVNNVSKNILPFSKLLKSGMEFVSLVFYIIFASLIWQTLVAVKRHTRR
ncbi:MAG: hypothetical protein GY936_03960 [Ignavibacteriae bacterium]|nr:hypothetical protein [Ignavibacteriota bacterium]